MELAMELARDIHEELCLSSATSKEVIKAGMVLTDEAHENELLCLVVTVY